MTAQEKLDIMLAAVQHARVVVEIREPEVAKLQAKRAELEAESIEKYGVPAGELRAWAMTEKTASEAEADQVWADYQAEVAK